ncbi:LysR family transcriptional regulator [Embleya sp. NBC_00896]|uniref:LysR family transcriptional regulator n=1 Tax=Embleya sp. NBC_00896 TaxID=2975961 RepID=UPI00386B016A|nr:LysR family transcriptional regulator [Embleya sp. NBC_00896]
MDTHLRDLRYFVATAEELNFTRAAERLFVSQPALSKQIRQLEEGLRTRLFDRDRRAVALTAAGAALLPAAREVIRCWDEAQRVVGDAVAAEAALLRVGLSTSVGRGLLQRAREGFAVRRPNGRLQFRQIDWDDATVGLADGTVDVALVWLPIPNAEAFSFRVVASEARWVMLREDHPLAGRESIAFEELLDEPFLALPSTAGPLRDYWLALDQRGDRPVRVGAVVSNVDETFAAIEEGSGVVLLAAGNAAIYQRPGTVAIEVTGLAPSELAVAWRSDDHRGPVRDFVDALGSA